jgi:hypothetical protein
VKDWKGYRGDLQVDLARPTGASSRELGGHYLGGKGLGTCLQRENPPGTDPVAGEQIVLVTGRPHRGPHGDPPGLFAVLP